MPYRPRLLLSQEHNRILKAGARADVRLARKVGRVGHAAFQHIAPVAIAAVDITMLVNLQEDARMAEGGGDAMARTVTGDSAGMDADDFGRCLHGCAVSKAGAGEQYRPAHMGIPSAVWRWSRFCPPPCPVVVAARIKSVSVRPRGRDVQIIFAPENMPFMVALALLVLLALTQLLGFLHIGDHGHFDHPHVDGHVGFGEGIISLLGIGRLPLFAWLTVFLAVFGLGGLTMQQVLDGVLGAMLPALPAGGIAFAGALPVTGILARPLAHIWPSDETTAIDIEALLAKRGRIEIGTSSRGNPARAAVRDAHGQMHLVMVEPHEDGTHFAQGDEVLLVRREGELFFAIACDPPFLTAGE